VRKLAHIFAKLARFLFSELAVPRVGRNFAQMSEGRQKKQLQLAAPLGARSPKLLSTISEGYFVRCSAEREASTAGWTIRCRVCCSTSKAELERHSSPSKKDTLFGDGTLSVHVPRRFVRRMRIARNHAIKFDARGTVLGTRVSQNFHSDFFSG